MRLDVVKGMSPRLRCVAAFRQRYETCTRHDRAAAKCTNVALVCACFLCVCTCRVRTQGNAPVKPPLIGARLSDRLMQGTKHARAVADGRADAPHWAT